MTLPLVWPESPSTRRADRLTSHAAADTVDTAGSRVAVLRVLHATQRPLADHEIESVHRTFTLTPYTGQRLRTARHELTELGVVIPDGETRTPRGRRAITWALKEQS